MGNRIFVEYAAASQEISSVPLLPVGTLAAASIGDDADTAATEEVTHSPRDDDADLCQPMRDANAAITARLQRIELLFDKLQFLTAQVVKEHDTDSEHGSCEASEEDVTSPFDDGSPPATLRSISEHSRQRIAEGAMTPHSIDGVPITPGSYRDPNIEPARYIPTPRRYDAPRVPPISLLNLPLIVSSTSLPKLPSVLSPPTQAKFLLTPRQDVSGELYLGSRALSGKCLANKIVTLREKMGGVTSDIEKCEEIVLGRGGQMSSAPREAGPHTASNRPSGTRSEDGPSVSSNAPSGSASRKKVSRTPSNTSAREDEPWTPSNVPPEMSSREDGSCTPSNTPPEMSSRDDGSHTPSNALPGMSPTEDGSCTPSNAPPETSLGEDGPRTPSNAPSSFSTSPSNTPPSTPPGAPPSPSQISPVQTLHYAPREDTTAGRCRITPHSIMTPPADETPTSEIKRLATPRDNHDHAITPRPISSRTPQSRTDESSSNCSTASECDLVSLEGELIPRSAPVNNNNAAVVVPPLRLFIAAPALTRPRLSAAIPRLNLALLRDGGGRSGPF